MRPGWRWSVVAPAPGLLQAVRLTPALRGDAWRRFLLTQQGAVAAYRTMLARGPAPAASPARLPSGI